MTNWLEERFALRGPVYRLSPIGLAASPVQVVESYVTLYQTRQEILGLSSPRGSCRVLFPPASGAIITADLSSPFDKRDVHHCLCPTR